LAVESVFLIPKIMKMLKIALITFMFLMIIGVILSAINYYYFAWTGYINPFAGTYKTITSISGSGREKLNQEYDLGQIYIDLRDNPNYSSKFLWKKTLIISRKFDNVEYIVEIEQYVSSEGEITNVGFNNFNHNYEISNKLHDGELPSTPDYYIEQNISQMINEMPINTEQKKELQSKVKVISATNLTGF
jgi:hypothetical protein